MGAAKTASLEALLAARRVWRGQPAALPPARQATGFPALDDALPTRGWPDAALSELLLPADGVGELRLLLPVLARLTQAGRDIVLVAPPYLPYPVAWQRAGVDFARVHLVDANPRDALWAAEQCLRAGCLAAVLCWPRQADDRALRRLQVACESGQALGFALRDAREARNPSPAALRVLFERSDEGVQLRVLKCRGGNPPARAIAMDARADPGRAALARVTASMPPVVRTRPQAASGERASLPGVLPFVPPPATSASSMPLPAIA
jgi:cell division inhibitor SulA